MLDIRNRALLEEIFGAWPSFHDAEVLALRLDRGEPRDDSIQRPKPSLEADIHLFETTPEVDEQGYYRMHKHTRVTMAFRGVDELSLEGFNNQNVLFDLVVTDISDRQLEGLRWKVSFESSYGLDGTFLCEEIEVLRVQQYEPDGPGAGPGRRLPAKPL